MRISFRNILYNYFRNIFLRVLRNASETVWGITRCCGGQHATTAALLIAIVASVLARCKGEHQALYAQTRPPRAPPRRPPVCGSRLKHLYY